ncbi:uncharacterized protein LOC116010136 [Ipomoea triloba]|uniref:uncharacterized protein LOC116010136 n=1 Tax=Ipomoea triloba TaxID=35885 RepID=UPI00125D43FB|nr:uncharacterized protein LOC116010136 [Ipomoea triloba]
MAPEQQHPQTLLHLFDSLWFQHQILASKNPTSISSNSNPTPQEDAENPKLSRTPTFISRSFSDQCLSSNDSLLDSEVPSPKSVLLESSKLQPILSGKEYIGISEDAGGSFTKNGENCSGRRRKRRKDGSGNSKSLSELEFKELKGFMDLGFVFSDKDRDSTLVSIIPGLQRLGREGVEEEGEKKGIAVSRPYLSEAWDVMGENMKNQNSLVNWRIPAFGNEMDMKNHLRFWAHTVASSAR